MRPRSASMLLPVLVLPVLTAGLVPAAPARAARPPAIANGEDVPVGRYPFAVKLTMTGIPKAGGGRRDSSCTGALLTPRWVITAGHCFRNTRGTHVSRLVARSTTATAGRTDLTTRAGHLVKVIAVRQSPTTDVALARLDQPITDITPVRLNRKPPKVGTLVRLAGYGLTVDNDQSSLATHLQTGQFKIVSVSKGYLGMRGRAPDATTSPCEHDSGGPYFTQQGDAQAVLVAVVSNGPACPHDEVDQSGRIDTITDWITSVVGQQPLTATTPPAAAATTKRTTAGPGTPAGRSGGSLVSAQRSAATDPTLRTALAAFVVVGFGAVLALVLGTRNRRRGGQRSGVRRHRR